jgi:hypothetical protein
MWGEVPALYHTTIDTSPPTLWILVDFTLHCTARLARSRDEFELTVASCWCNLGRNSGGVRGRWRGARGSAVMWAFPTTLLQKFCPLDYDNKCLAFLFQTVPVLFRLSVMPLYWVFIEFSCIRVFFHTCLNIHYSPFNYRYSVTLRENLLSTL